ncbi:UNVERIFIED_CONTAM: hypothetical protein Sangu_1123900 [Sesamum angustifolium]|uniref:Uncharacterized protein n=1 Tax=Sesamum angustifolium TaxID=2727405 RepID=A0AAW2P0G6_9LAMI
MGCEVTLYTGITQKIKSSPLFHPLLLHDEEEALKEKGIFIHSLEKGPVPPSGPSGCTNIPGSGGSGCPINEMHFAGGHAPPHPSGSTAYPHSSAAAAFGVATKQK